MLIAIIAHHTSAGASSECAWYFVAYTFDTTLGLLLTVLLHKAILRLARCWKKRHGLPKGAGGEAEAWYDIIALCGNYGGRARCLFRSAPGGRERGRVVCSRSIARSYMSGAGRRAWTGGRSCG